MQPVILTPLAREMLAAHNAERAQHGYPALRWNETLARNAQAYANELARTGNLGHSSRAGRGAERENLSKGLPNWSVRQHANAWVKEKRHFKAGTFPNVSSTGNWADVGHYSQMIWPETTDVGCGVARGRGFSWLVCRYTPGGNKDGKPVGKAIPALRR